MNDDEPPLGEDIGDKAFRVAASLPSAIPFAGGVIQSIVTELIPNKRLERIEVYLKHLSNRINAQTLEQSLSSEEKIDTFEEGLLQASRALSEDRKKRIATIVSKGLSGNDDANAEARQFLRLLLQLGDQEIALLLEQLDWESKNPDASDEQEQNRRREFSDLEMLSRRVLMNFGFLKAGATYGGEVFPGSITTLGRRFVIFVGVEP